MISMFKGILSLSPHVFEIFRNMCIKIYKHNSSQILSAPYFAWQAVLKRLK